MKKFNCLCCGDCCSGNMSIKLNIYDLYKMGKHLKLNSTKELFDKKILCFKTGQNSIFIPEIVFKTSPYKFCPFLINDLNEDMVLKGYCSLHPFIKPLVCILAPISKLYKTVDKSINYSSTIPTENCSGEFYGNDVPIEDLLKPVKDEIIYENQFYDILDSIMINEIENYREDLYYFNLEDSFIKTFNNLRKTYNTIGKSL